MYYEATRIWTPVKSYRRQIVEEQMSFSKLSHSVSVSLFKLTAFLKATKYTKDFTSYTIIIISLILSYTFFYLVCRSWNHAGFSQDICSSSDDNNTILSVVCSFLLLLVIIYPWLPNIYNASYY